MSKILEKQLADVFEQDYQGYDYFVENVINRVFTGDDTFEALPVPEDILDDTNRRAATNAGILQTLKIGSIDAIEGIDVYDITLRDNKQLQYNRVGIQQLIRSQQIFYSNAFLLFHNEHPEGKEWRFSFFYKQGKNKDTTSAKRFTYLFGKNLRARTASERFSRLAEMEKDTDNLLEAFSVEALSKTFFDEYRYQYKSFCDFLFKHKNDTEYFGSEFATWEDKYLRDYVKKMMGRITFIYFLQRKGWMNGDYEYMQNAFKQSALQDNYLDAFLEPLFFGVLNTKPEERKDLFNEEGWDLSLLDEWKNVPYLNGGLFERDKQDEPKSKFPAEMFNGLFDFYSRYNFTIDENDPDDAEVGVDPEMLGKIFENLLEDNKDKGAFYTPKEIVDFMCQESLIAYLQTGVTDEATRMALRRFVETYNVEYVNGRGSRLANQIVAELQRVKICDPAIGSGAFPMGLLNLLVKCREAIGNSQSRVALKREIIQNNIYGVDIEKGAVDIARLRFWLALVVDENEPQPLPNLDYKIMCGDSLLHRFALDAPFKNVLRDYNEKNGTKYTLDDYRQWVYDYTDISDHTQKDDFRQRIEEIKHAVKTKLSKEEMGKIAKVRGAIDNLHMEDLFGGNKKEKEKKIKALQKELKALEQQREEIESNKIYEQAFEWRFEFPALLDEDGNFTGFDIVIGNPPYNELRDLDVSVQDGLKATIYYESAKGGRLNMFQFFYPLSLDVAKNNGIISLITQNSILAESSTLGNRKLFLDNTDILSIDSFPERDNTRTRVFESVKMSVCICTLKKNLSPNPKAVIPITIWHSKFMRDNHSLEITKQEIMDIYPDEYIFPICSNKSFAVLKKLIAKKEYSITASAGEIDMTKYRPYFNLTMDGNRVLTGAQILRYVITNKPSQGEIYYLEKKYQSFSSKRLSEIQNPRIVLQRITGVDSRIRIIATYSDKCYLCANSTNYIIPTMSVDSLYLLGVINSALINFFVKQTSTNTNITATVIGSFPIIISNKVAQTAISKIVSGILQAKQTNNKDTTNEEIQIDLIVYHLYGLTYDEVLIVDPETPITREEYEKRQ